VPFSLVVTVKSKYFHKSQKITFVKAVFFLGGKNRIFKYCFQDYERLLCVLTLLANIKRQKALARNLHAEAELYKFLLQEVSFCLTCSDMASFFEINVHTMKWSSLSIGLFLHSAETTFLYLRYCVISLPCQVSDAAVAG
jgi:hypothetical protein